MPFILLLLALSAKSSILFASDYAKKSFLCSTQTHSVKGGFTFMDNIELIKYNILISSNGKNFIKKTHHCYKVVEDRVLISQDNLANGCGIYHSYINSESLIYNVPFKDKILYAQCRQYDSDIESKLKYSLDK